MPISFDTLLAIVTFALSVGSLVPVFYFLRNQPWALWLTSVAVSVVLVVVATGVAAYRALQHEQQVEAVSRKLVIMVTKNGRPFDQLREELPPYVELRVMSDALDQAIRSGDIDHAIRSLHDHETGEMLRVRVYFRSKRE